MRCLLVAVGILAGLSSCKFWTREENISKIAEEHPNWKRGEVEALFDGIFWRGMTQEQVSFYFDNFHSNHLGARYHHTRKFRETPEIYIRECFCALDYRSVHFRYTSLTISKQTHLVTDWYVSN
ncbi:MAG: hypothetical protein ACRD1X_12310 [Vicinamibacteria bacterium]